MRITNQIKDQFIAHPLWMIVVMGILVRLCVAILYQHITIYPDSSGYLYLADRLFQFDLTGYQGERTPGYPFLICLAMQSPLVTVLLQSALGMATLVMAYRILLLLGVGRSWSLGGILVLNLYLPSVFFEFALLSETLTLFFVTTAFYVFFKIVVRPSSSASSYFLLASICAYLVCIKPFYIFLPFVFVALLLVGGISCSMKTLRRYALVLLLPVMVVTGWSYLNKINTGYFVPTTLYGFNAAQNCVAFAENTSNQYTDIGIIYAKYRDKNREINRNTAMSIWEAHDELESHTRLALPALSAKLYGYSTTTIGMNPMGYLKQVLISWGDFWKTSLYWKSEQFISKESGRYVSAICYVQRILFQLIKCLFVVLVGYNIILFWRNRLLTPPLIISVVVLVASVLQALSSYGTNSRFCFPFEVCIALSVLLNVRAWRNKKEKG